MALAGTGVSVGFIQESDDQRRIDELRNLCRAYNHGDVHLPNSVREVHHFDQLGLDQGKCDVMSPTVLEGCAPLTQGVEIARVRIIPTCQCPLGLRNPSEAANYQQIDKVTERGLVVTMKASCRTCGAEWRQERVS